MDDGAIFIRTSWENLLNYDSTSQSLISTSMYLRRYFSPFLPQFPIKRYCPVEPLLLMAPQLCLGRRKAVEMVRGTMIIQAEGPE